jgi:hypothetical protein
MNGVNVSAMNDMINVNAWFCEIQLLIIHAYIESCKEMTIPRKTQNMSL